MTTAKEKTHHLRQEMVLKQVIDSKQDRLVQLSASAVKLLEKDGKMKTKMQTSQLRNLLNVSLDTPSTDVVISFICYQIARNKESWETKKDGFGHTVIMMLQDEITNLAIEVTDEVAKKIGDDKDRDALLAEVQTRLVRLYLGYLHRWFYFLDKSDDKREAINTMLYLSKPDATPHPTGGTS